MGGRKDYLNSILLIIIAVLLLISVLWACWSLWGIVKNGKIVKTVNEELSQGRVVFHNQSTEASSSESPESSSSAT